MRRQITTLVGVSALVPLITVFACGDDAASTATSAGGATATGTTTTGPGGNAGGANTTTTATGGNGSSVTTGGTGGTGGAMSAGGNGGAGGVCDDRVAPAVAAVRAIDLVIIADQSFSMDQEIAAIESNINTNFAQVLAAASIDYRIIVVGQHGQAALDLCIGPPLSGTTNCAGPPVNVAGQFYHYSVNVQSHDALCRLLGTLDGSEPDHFNLAPMGWSTWLRSEALKAFVVATDDGTLCSYGGTTFNDMNTDAGGLQAGLDFDTALRQASPLQFGSGQERNYLWYSILGLAEKNPAMPGQPWLSSDPVTVNECTPGAVDPGTAYQRLSKGTAGLRFPICSPTSFGSYFQNIAQDIEAKAPNRCDLDLPLPAMGQTLDINAVTILITPSNVAAPQVELTKVDDVTQCGATNFYVDAGRIKVCPSSCAGINADPTATVETKIACGG